MNDDEINKLEQSRLSEARAVKAFLTSPLFWKTIRSAYLIQQFKTEKRFFS